ncbi:MAG: hypothetical protein J7K73_04380 [Nanoarchaeota archaeon]|nr:hypothetical protein [Nanoarchaeota archaeon]
MAGRKTLEERLGIPSRDEFLKRLKQLYNEGGRLEEGTPLYRLAFKNRFAWGLVDRDGRFSIRYLEEQIGAEPRKTTVEKIWSRENILYCIRFFEDVGVGFNSTNTTKCKIPLPDGRMVVTSPQRVYAVAQRRDYFYENDRFVGVDGLKRMAYNNGVNIDIKSEVIRHLVDMNGGIIFNGVLLNSNLSWEKLEELVGVGREELIAEALGNGG